MTDKQLYTIKLYALGFNLESIARKQKVSVSAVRKRIKSIAKNYPTEFDNASGVRHAYQRAKYNIQHPDSIENCEGRI